MSDEPMNPVEVEAAIKRAANQIAKSAKTCSDAYKEFLEADRAYDVAYHHALLAFEGPAWRAKSSAEVNTQVERENRDLKDVAYRYADRKAKASENILRALQSINASVRNMYGPIARGDS